MPRGAIKQEVHEAVMKRKNEAMRSMRSLATDAVFRTFAEPFILPAMNTPLDESGDATASPHSPDASADAATGEAKENLTRFFEVALKILQNDSEQ